MPVRGATVFGPEHQTDTQGRATLICVDSTISGSPPVTTQDRTQRTNPIPGQKLKFLTQLGIEPGPPCCRAGILPTTPWRRMIEENPNEKKRLKSHDFGGH